MIHINVMTQKLRARLNHRRWEERNHEAEARRLCAYRKEHPSNRLKAQRKYREANREIIRPKALVYSLKYYKEHPDKAYDNAHKCRARRLNAIGSFTTKQFRALGNICLCCGRNETELAHLGRRLVPDHVVPVARGGSNDISNIQPLCHGKGGCNNHKGVKYIDYRGSACGGLPFYLQGPKLLNAAAL